MLDYFIIILYILYEQMLINLVFVVVNLTSIVSTICTRPGCRRDLHEKAVRLVDFHTLSPEKKVGPVHGC